MSKSVLIALRLPTNMKAEIDKLVESGKFQTLSQVIREALKQFLEGVEKP